MVFPLTHPEKLHLGQDFYRASWTLLSLHFIFDLQNIVILVYEFYPAVNSHVCMH